MGRGRRARPDLLEKNGESEMDQFSCGDCSRSEAEVPADLLAGRLMELDHGQEAAPARTDRLTPKMYAVMAVTTLLTFGTLTTGYQLLFAPHPFA